MAERTRESVNEEMEDLRRQRRLTLALEEFQCFPEPFASTFCPQFTAKDLHALKTSSEHPDRKKQSTYKYMVEQLDKSGYHDRDSRDHRYSNRRDQPKQAPKTVLVQREGKATDLASQALKEGGAYMTTVQTVIAQMKTRELLEQERYLVEAMARMEMKGVKREREAESLREALDEWIEDAERLAMLQDEDSFFAIVTRFYVRRQVVDEEEEEKEKDLGKMEEVKEEEEKKEDEKVEEKKENKEEEKKEIVEVKKTKTEKKKEKKKREKEEQEKREKEERERKEREELEKKKKEEEKVDEKKTKETVLFSLRTRFNGTEYSIDVEMPNDSDVIVKTSPRLEGIEEQSVEMLSSFSLLDAITGPIWKAVGIVE